ncbi:MAG: PBP1A family penicillin-binding protein [Actinomycetota bacterium]|nr:PBP1A family penicillin-binding protein [Actinomycetota bacterium]
MSRRTRGSVLRVALTSALLLSGCTLRPIDLANEKPLSLRSTVTDAEGRVLARFFNENRSPVRLRQVSPRLIDAVLAAEDKDFFDHPGYDLRAMARAMLTNLREGEIVQGGSTITQQYAKNTYFRRPSQTLERKARELRFSIEIERTLTKREILERYLNTVYLGEGAYGVRAAAQTYFGHDVSKMTLREAALVAGLIKAPSFYNPYRHPRRAEIRRDYVIDRMTTVLDVPSRPADRAKKADLGLLNRPPQTSTRQRYFVEAVRQELLKDHRLGNSPDARDRRLHEGGLRIRTTLEPRLQAAAERSVAAILDRPGDPEAALVAIRPHTGQVVAMVGGRDWSSSQVNLATGTAGGGSGRQAGSAFKPIVAATALEAGIPLSTSYESAPAVFDLGNGETWPVANSEGRDYGRLTLADALVDSVNGVYARLALDVGGPQIASQAHLMGIKSRLSSYPSIALGSAEVSAMDMATAYATIANGGTAIESTTIRSIATPDGQTYAPDQEIVPGALSPGNAYLLSRTMEQVIERGTGTAADIGRPAAGKTGTTNDFGDAWFVGYTPQLVTAVWVGYPHARIPMTSVHGIPVFGGTFPAQIWQRFMTAAHAGLPVQAFEIPKSELVTVTVDPKTGLLAASWCPGKEEVMLQQLAPTEVCPPPPPPPPSPLPSPSPTPEPSPSPAPTASPSDTEKDDQKEKKGNGDQTDEKGGGPKNGSKPPDKDGPAS